MTTFIVPNNTPTLKESKQVMKTIIASLKAHLEEIDSKIKFFESQEKCCQAEIGKIFQNMNLGDSKSREENEPKYRYWARLERETQSLLSYLDLARSEVKHSIKNLTYAEARIENINEINK